ncbi:hypothetical protein WJX84_009345 [Apatococcus fuscideae]|uniref:Uncharacterized protein n=1 Tax=Apatococcus fuscideae TaxID=2026836 RepID=A0AAW1T9T8_9CHLO
MTYPAQLKAKLAHPLPEVQLRSARSLLFKLKHRLVDSNDLGQADISALTEMASVRATCKTIEALLLAAPPDHQSPAQQESILPAQQKECHMKLKAVTRKLDLDQAYTAAHKENDSGQSNMADFAEVGIDERLARQQTRAGCRMDSVPALAGSAEGNFSLFEGCVQLPATSISAQDDQHLFDLLIRLQFSQEAMVVLQAVEALHGDIQIMAAPEVLLQRPAGLQALLHLLDHPDPQSLIPYAVLRLLQSLVNRFKQRLLLKCDGSFQSGPELLQGPGNASAEVSSWNHVNAKASLPDLRQEESAYSKVTLAAHEICLAVVPLLHNIRFHPASMSFMSEQCPTEVFLKVVNSELMSCLEVLVVDEVACNYVPAIRAVFVGLLAALNSTAARAVTEAAAAQSHVGRLDRLLATSCQVGLDDAVGFAREACAVLAGLHYLHPAEAASAAHRLTAALLGHAVGPTSQSLQHLLQAAPITLDDKELWAVLLELVCTLLATGQTSAHACQLLLVALRSSALEWLAAPASVAAPGRAPLALCNQGSRPMLGDLQEALLNAHLTQAVMETMAMTLQAAILQGMGRVAFGLVDGTGLIQTLVDGYVASAAATSTQRLWAVIVISTLVETVHGARGDDQHLSTSPGQQDVSTVLSWTLQSLLRHVCMAKMEERVIPTHAAQQLQQTMMQCLKLIMAALTTSSWSLAWAEVGGCWWLMRMARDEDAVVRAAAWEMLVLLIQPDAHPTLCMLLKACPDVATTALKAVMDGKECSGVRAAAIQFLCMAMVDSEAAATTDLNPDDRQLPGLWDFGVEAIIRNLELWASLSDIMQDETAPPRALLAYSPAAKMVALKLDFHVHLMELLSAAAAAMPDRNTHARHKKAAGLHSHTAAPSADVKGQAQENAALTKASASVRQIGLLLGMVGHFVHESEAAGHALMLAGLGQFLDQLWQPGASREQLHHILCLLVRLLPSCQPARAALSTKRGPITLLERAVKCLADAGEDATFHLAASALRSLSAAHDGAAQLLRSTTFLSEGRRLLQSLLQGKQWKQGCAILQVYVNLAASPAGQKQLFQSPAAAASSLWTLAYHSEKIKAALRKLPDLALHLGTAEYQTYKCMKDKEAPMELQQLCRDAAHCLKQLRAAVVTS